MKYFFNNEIYIKNRRISEKDSPYIIAEAGVNHDGDINKAIQLIRIAAESGADAVKFQLFNANSLIRRNERKADYQIKNMGSEETQFEMLRKLELDSRAFRILKEEAHQLGLAFIVTPFDEESLQVLIDLEIDAMKISSTDITNPILIEQASRVNIPLIISTGMSYSGEVTRAVDICNGNNKDVIILQCTSNYPMDEKEANLSVINGFKLRYNMLSGYSDHSRGIGVSPFAVAAGAVLLEKHFTYDPEASGPDHRASLSPDELRAYVIEIKRVHQLMGYGEKMPTLSELKTRKSLQKSIVASKPIAAGQMFDLENLTVKRAGGTGLSAFYINSIVGKIAEKDFDIDEVISID